MNATDSQITIKSDFHLFVYLFIIFIYLFIYLFIYFSLFFIYFIFFLRVALHVYSIRSFGTYAFVSQFTLKDKYQYIASIIRLSPSTICHYYHDS